MDTDKILDMGTVVKNKDKYEKLKATIQEQRAEIIGNMKSYYNIDEKLDNFTEEEINEMSFEQMKETFVDGEGNFIFDENEFPQKMIMDFIIYLKQSRVAFEKMDVELDKMDEYLKEFDKELKSIVGDTSFNKTLKASIEADLQKEDISEATKERCNIILAAMDDAMTLRPIFELYEKISVKNTLEEYKNVTRRIPVLQGYAKVCQDAGIEPKLLKMGDFEATVLTEKYHAHRNLFIFIVARYIKYLGPKAGELYNRTFIAQLMNFLREIVMGEESSHYQADIKEVETLKMNICSLLDKFYN